jgi:Tfp pilus assembly protein FimV
LHLAEIYLNQNRVEKAREQVRLALEIADDEAMKAKAQALQERVAAAG